MAACFDIAKDERLNTPSVTDKNRLANAAKLTLFEKLKELAWKQADAEVVQAEMMKA